MTSPHLTPPQQSRLSGGILFGVEYTYFLLLCRTLCSDKDQECAGSHTLELLLSLNAVLGHLEMSSSHGIGCPLKALPAEAETVFS